MACAPGANSWSVPCTGLMRAHAFEQDDAYMFCREKDVQGECPVLTNSVPCLLHRCGRSWHCGTVQYGSLPLALVAVHRHAPSRSPQTAVCGQ
jgi:hypothetical protein